ncbi:MAG TPA: 30S ribosomal protein S9 [Cyclobacteriaceae bacterium]|jgi:small subunit ribosomal protein S9|nr:30S ribosomal protein S9 [Cyclobacteriaceae bacterium]HNP08836.1 30S ribosomal protein S9 [Cyclobacteriaceae bacterium]HRK54684.1 30S ribosomal protein S9 [Cyclobacteriaceae bacterium]
MDITNKTGRRKTAIARVYLQPGNGTVTINNRDLKDYFTSEIHQITVNQPFTILKLDNQYDVNVNVEGGGIKGQAEAVRLGITRALVEVNAENKPELKKEGLTTRDSRSVERKKYGKRKARKKFQFSKR